MLLNLNYHGLAQTDPEDIKAIIAVPHYARSSESPPVNLRERNLEWVTIPATGLTGGETEVTHELSMSRLVAHAADTVKEGGGELKTGERFKMHMSDGYIGTSW